MLAAEPQYQSYHLLLSEVSAFTSRLTHNAYRPRLRPAGAPLLLRLLFRLLCACCCIAPPGLQVAHAARHAFLYHLTLPKLCLWPAFTTCCSWGAGSHMVAVRRQGGAAAGGGPQADLGAGHSGEWMQHRPAPGMLGRRASCCNRLVAGNNTLQTQGLACIHGPHFLFMSLLYLLPALCPAVHADA